MVTKLIEVRQSGNNYSLREVFVNPEHVMMLRENSVMKTLQCEGKLPDNLDNRVEFTTVFMNTNVTLTVVGSPDIVESKLRSTRKLLRG